MDGEEIYEYKEIATSAIDEISTVRLYAETWNDHIVPRHPEVNDRLEDSDLLETVKDPSAVYKSATNRDSRVYVSNNYLYNENPLHVPVKIIEGTTSARIQTAYFRRPNPSWVQLAGGSND